MKITQTENQIQLKSGGIGQFIIGLVTIIVGIGIAVVLLGSPDDSGKKAPAWSVLIGIFFIGFGVLMALFAKNRSVTVQKGGDTMVNAKRILGGAAQQQSVPTASIVAVRLSTYMESSGNNGGNGGISGGDSSSRRSVLSLVLNNNDLIEVGGSGGGIGGFSMNGINITSLITKAPLSKEADQVATFLGVPLQADDASSITGAIKSVATAFHKESSQPAPFNPQPQTPTEPAAPVPTQTPVPPAPIPPSQIPPTQQVPPTENPGGPTAPPPPYTPQQ